MDGGWTEDGSGRRPCCNTAKQTNQGKKGNKTENNKIKGRRRKRRLREQRRRSTGGLFSGKAPSFVCSSDAASLRAPRIHVTANYGNASRQISSRRTAAVPRQRVFRPAGLPDLQTSSSLDENTYKNMEEEKNKPAATSRMRPSIKAQETENNASIFRSPCRRHLFAFKGQLAKAAMERTPRFSPSVQSTPLLCAATRLRFKAENCIHYLSLAALR